MQRSLGNFERLIWHAGQVNSFNFVVMAQVTGPLTVSILRKALDIIQPSYSMLNVSVTQTDGMDFFSTTSAKICLTAKLIESEDQWQDEINRELNLPFAIDSSNLVRVTLLSASDSHQIIITFNHIIADAISGMHFLYQLIKVVDGVMNGDKNLEIKSYRLLPAIEDLLISPEQKSKNESNIKKTIYVTPSNEVNRTKTSILHFQLTAQQTNSIIALCHRNAISVHSFVSAVLNNAMFEVNEDRFDRLMCLSPLNMRAYLPFEVGSDELGYLLSRVDVCVFNRPEWDIIKKAKFFHTQFRGFIDLDLHKAILLNMKELFAIYFTEANLHEKLQFKSPGLLVSNIGKFSVDSNFKNIKIKNMHFSLACQGILGNEQSMAATITTFNDKMNINFLYLEPNISIEKAKHYAKLTLDKLIVDYQP